MKLLSVLYFLFLLLAFGQTREEELTQLRRESANHLTPETNSRTEEFLRKLKDDNLLARINYGYNGIGLKVGGMVNGSGFAVGPHYFRDDLRDGMVTVRAAAKI